MFSRTTTLPTAHAGASADLRALRRFLARHLTDDVLPFWLRHALDPEGGINTCIRDDGTVVSRDKWLWSQWRAVWVFSKLHRGFRPASPDWLEAARRIAGFALRHGWDDRAQGCRLLVGGDGEPLRGCESLYVDGFAIYGLTEYALASGLDEPLAWARRIADRAMERLREPHDRIPHFPYPIPAGARVHGLPMMFSLVLWELGRACGERRYLEAATGLQGEIFASFHRPEFDLIVERVAADGSLYAGAPGRAVVPGHVVEDLWFQIHIFRDRGESARIREACRLILRHLEIGWDSDPRFGGGILLAVDAQGGGDVAWNFHDSKLWWPHTEALYALLLAYEHTGDPACLGWYDRVHDYAFRHFPIPAWGEWRQRLKRDGTELAETVALPVKDPFHLPRALYYCVETLDRLAGAARPADPPDA
ncbi:MAG: AGE family epimerase/isomerase [Opitutaceae bacterium]